VVAFGASLGAPACLGAVVLAAVLQLLLRDSITSPYVVAARVRSDGRGPDSAYLSIYCRHALTHR
jgi:hypothetical protein